MPPPTSQEVFTLVRETVINSITNYILKRINKVPKFQILDLIIPRERKIRSIVGGMETSLGTTLWEPLAKNLALLNGFEVVNQNLLVPAIMPANLQNTLQIVFEGRMSANQIYNSTYCHDRIREICQTFINNPIPNFVKAPTGYGVDIWLKKDNVNYFFDTKTVQTNIGGYTRYFMQLINWYAYFYSQFPNQNAQAKIVFPYNPYRLENFWENTNGNGWPLERDVEALVENQFWNFCSGIPNTYEIIHSAFVSISESGELEEILDQIFNPD